MVCTRLLERAHVRTEPKERYDLKESSGALVIGYGEAAVLKQIQLLFYCEGRFIEWPHAANLHGKKTRRFEHSEEASAEAWRVCWCGI